MRPARPRHASVDFGKQGEGLFQLGYALVRFGHDVIEEHAVVEDADGFVSRQAALNGTKEQRFNRGSANPELVLSERRHGVEHSCSVYPGQHGADRAGNTQVLARIPEGSENVVRGLDGAPVPATSQVKLKKGFMSQPIVGFDLNGLLIES